MSLAPRAVLITRPTPYEELIARHATRNQAEFFLERRGQRLAEVEALHHRVHAAIAQVRAAIPLEWRRNIVQRHELDRFLFEPDDIVLVIGQDGLVANAAKYLSGQRVIGVNPLADLFDGILVSHSPDEGCRRIVPAAAGRLEVECRAMAEVRLDDGQTLCALNELFVGQRTHQSARYELKLGEAKARHSSSGVIIATGTGSTGWARSIHLERGSALGLPRPAEPALAYFVREVFPSISTSTELTEGRIPTRQALEVTSRMDEGVIFGDGIESDFLPFGWGARAEFRVAEKTLRLAR